MGFYKQLVHVTFNFFLCMLKLASCRTSDDTQCRSRTNFFTIVLFWPHRGKRKATWGAQVCGGFVACVCTCHTLMFDSAMHLRITVHVKAPIETAQYCHEVWLRTQPHTSHIAYMSIFMWHDISTLLLLLHFLFNIDNRKPLKCGTINLITFTSATVVSGERKVC